MDPGRFAEGVVVEHPGRVAPFVPRLVRRVLAPLVTVAFRPRLEGVEHLPAQGPFLLVANHSAGVGLAELTSFIVLYLRQVGPGRRLAGFAHPAGFRLYPLQPILAWLGAIPSTYAAAEQALSQGVPILVFPGGDHETMRPLWQAGRVDFGGHRGFLRIARAAGVPIVPMGIRGGHPTAPILFRARWLASLLGLPRLLGVRNWGLSVLGVAGAALLLTLLPWAWPWRVLAAWLWLGNPLVFVPWIPWTVRFRIGAPLPAPALFGAEGGEGELTRALRAVEEAVQRLVDGA